MSLEPSPAVLPANIKAVVFDVGETLVDETRTWCAQADASGVTRFTLLAALGAVIERGEQHHAVWDVLRISDPQLAYTIEAEDFYPDALGCLSRLSRAGYILGLAGNQPLEAEEALRGLGLPVSFVASSDGWGVEKPSDEFFSRVSREAGCPPEQVAYVGDRVDNDVIPACRAGMWAVFIRRGPWGHLHSRLPAANRAQAQIETLTELLPSPTRGI